MNEREQCPLCESTNISCHLGHCECEDCGYEWSVQEEQDDEEDDNS